MSHYTTFEKRLEIENGLRENLSFGEIVKRLGKDRSTFSREVRKYALPKKSGYGSVAYNACVHRPNCTKTHVCTDDCCTSSVKCRGSVYNSALHYCQASLIRHNVKYI